MSFSDKNLSVFRCRRCHKLFTFSSSSPKPLGQFQPNLAQSILGWRGFKFVQMKGPALFQREIITKLREYIDKFKKFFFFKTTGPISTKLAQIIFGWRGFVFVLINGPHPFPRGDNYKFAKLHWQIFKKNLLLQNQSANFNQTWHK